MRQPGRMNPRPGTTTTTASSNTTGTTPPSRQDSASAKGMSDSRRRSPQPTFSLYAGYSGMKKGLPGLSGSPWAESAGFISDPLKTLVFQRFRAPFAFRVPARVPTWDARIRLRTLVRANLKGRWSQSYDRPRTPGRKYKQGRIPKDGSFLSTSSMFLLARPDFMAWVPP